MNGHLTTIASHVAGKFAGLGYPRPRGVAIPVRDDVRPATEVRGLLDENGSNHLVVVVHGLGGSANSGYVLAFARRLLRAGFDVFRLNLRGADRAGDDFYHAGLSSDLEAVLASPALERYASRSVVGFSLGGHLALHLVATGAPDIHRVVAICPPLDLARGADHIDAPARSVYRQHILKGLREMYRTLPAEHHHGQIPNTELRSIRTIRQWDARTVVRRFGFASVEAYYHSQSAGPRLGGVQHPTLVVVGEQDPMIPATSVAPHLARSSSSVETWWHRRGGHVGFPIDTRVWDRCTDWLATGLSMS